MRLGYITIAAAWLIAVFCRSVPDDALIGVLLLIVFVAAHAFALGFCVTSAGYLTRALFLQPDSRSATTYVMLAFSMLPLLAVAWLIYIAVHSPKV